MNQRVALENAIGPVSRETFERLSEFERLFLRWNSRINLAANSTLSDFWTRHVIDSAQLWGHGRNSRSWLDLGSGGGLPGIVIAILGTPTGLSMSLVESNNKKAAFLRSCGAELGLSVEIVVERIEKIEPRRAPDCISARALAALPTLFDLTSRWLAPGTQAKALLHKGRDFQREIQQARDEWDFDLIEHVSVVDAMSRVLEVSNVKRLER